MPDSGPPDSGSPDSGPPDSGTARRSGRDGLLKGVRAVARLAPELDDVAIAEVLWLAAARSGTTVPFGSPPPQKEKRPSAEPADTDEPAAPSASPQESPAPVGGETFAPAHRSRRESATTSDVYENIAGSAPGGAVTGRPVSVPRGGALPKSLELGRALRPFKRAWAPGPRLGLDVEATARDYARSGELLPTLRPHRERFLDLALVVDRSPSMAVWREVAQDFAGVLRRLGAFKRVRVWDLSMDEDGQPLLRTANGGGAETPPPTGRHHQIVVFSDCSAEGWYQPRIWQLLHEWGAAVPTTLVNPLPSRLWRLTALDLPAVRVASSGAPIVRNTRLEYHLPWHLRFGDRADEPLTPLPVAMLTPYGLESWARVLMSAGAVAGADAAACDAVLIPARGRFETYPEDDDEPPLTGEELVAGFLGSASAPAARLAVMCAPYVSLTMPLLHLVQQTMVPEATVAEVAEVVVSGLFTMDDAGDAGDAEDGEDGEDGVPGLSFRPGVQASLEELLGADDAWRMHEALTRYIAAHTGSLSSLAAAIRDPDGLVSLPAELRPFAAATADTLRVLGALPTVVGRAETAGGVSGVEQAAPQRDGRHAVLIGVGDYSELPPLPNVRANVKDLAKALAAPQLWNLPAGNISTPGDLSRPHDVRMAVRAAAAQATDTLLVYYAGHALLDDQGRLQLATASSTEDAASCVPYTWIHEEVSASKAARKIVILDCCYAERASQQVASMEVGPEHHPMPNTDGIYLIFASAMNEQTLVGSGRHTVFTGELLKRLEEGMVYGPKMLSVQAIYNDMLAAFPAQGFPLPRLYGDLRWDSVVFGKNPAWTPERDLLAEQQAAMSAWSSPDGGRAPQLGIKVLGGDQTRGEFHVQITGRNGMSVDVELTNDVLDRALAERYGDDEPEALPLIWSSGPQTPMLEVLAWALLNRLLPAAGPSVWRPHRVGHGRASEADILRDPGRQEGARRVVPTEADRQVSGLIEEEQHVLLLGAGASGKTTIAQSQAQARRDRRGDGVIWLDLTDPDDGAESVLLTLLGMPEHERYLLVVDNLQAQAPVLRRHPVLDLVPRLIEELGLRITVLATAWPGIERVLDVDEYYLAPVMAQSLGVITQLVSGLPQQHRDDVLDLAEGDIEVALVALDYYREHDSIPSVRQVAEQLARLTGADRLTDPRQRRLLYWFACLGALEIDVPQRYVDSWQEREDRVAVNGLRRHGLIEPNDEAWSIGNSTRARLLMLYALDHWDSASEFESRGRLVYDHLRRMGPRHIHNTLAQLRLKYDQGQRGELGDLWVQCLDLCSRLEFRSDLGLTRGAISLAAAFAAIAVGAMGSEYTANIFATVAQGLDLLELSAASPDAEDYPWIVLAAPISRTASSSAADIDLSRRLMLGVLITAEAVAGEPSGARTRRFQKLVRQAAKPSGALGPADAPWVTAVIASGMIQLQRGRRHESINDAVLWLSHTLAEGGAFRDGWSIGATGRRWQGIGDRAHLDVFATALCVKALHDGSQAPRSRVLRRGLAILREALPGLAEDGGELARAAAVSTLLHCGEDWRELAQDLRESLRWAAIAIVDDPEDEAPGVTTGLWAASMLLSAIPPIVMRELESIVDRLLDVEEPDDPEGPDPYSIDEEPTEADLATERLEIVKEAVATMHQEIDEQIARRRSILRDMADAEAIKTINAVLTEWEELKRVLDGVIADLSRTTLSETIPVINELGAKVYGNSWRVLEP